jgi:hypothetical protein
VQGTEQQQTMMVNGMTLFQSYYLSFCEELDRALEIAALQAVCSKLDIIGSQAQIEQMLMLSREQGQQKREAFRTEQKLKELFLFTENAVRAQKTNVILSEQD